MGTVSSRFYRWRKAAVFDRVLQRLQAQADALGDLDWDLHFVNATVERAHQHATGACRSGAIRGGGNGQKCGRGARAQSGRAFHQAASRAEGGGKPITAVLTVGERHEQFALDALMDKGAATRTTVPPMSLAPGKPRG